MLNQNLPRMWLGMGKWPLMGTFWQIFQIYDKFLQNSRFINNILQITSQHSYFRDYVTICDKIIGIVSNVTIFRASVCQNWHASYQNIGVVSNVTVFRQVHLSELTGISSKHWSCVKLSLYLDRYICQNWQTSENWQTSKQKEMIKSSENILTHKLNMR